MAFHPHNPYLTPMITTRNFWDSWSFPAILTDQHFGTGLSDSDLLPPLVYRGYVVRPRSKAVSQSSGKSEVKNERDEFEVKLNVSHFTPEELEVKVVDNFVVVHGKHEGKSDEHGYIEREFTRRYILPEGTEVETVKSSLSPDGILTVTAPKKVIQPPPSNERVIPITMAKELDQK